MIFNLGSKKVENNENYSPQLTSLHNSILVRIFDTPYNIFSNVEGKSDIRKVHTSSINSSSTLFLCSIRSMYIIVNRAQKQFLVLKSYILGVYSLISTKRHYYIPPL